MTIERIERIADALEISPVTLVGWDLIDVGMDGDIDTVSRVEDNNQNELKKSLNRMYLSLNEQGRQKLLEYAKDLGRIEMYRD